MPISTINQNGLNAPLTLTAPVLGTPASINLSNATALPKSALPSGSVLQVVSATTTTSVSISSSSYTDTGLSASITPTSSSSKILVLIYQLYRYTGAAVGGGILIVRGSTALTTVNTDGTGPYQVYSPTGQDMYSVFAASYLDSPATTSSTTYKTTARPYNPAGSMVFQNNGPTANSMSTITLMEIAA
jgi:hypothetical protein